MKLTSIALGAAVLFAGVLTLSQAQAQTGQVYSTYYGPNGPGSAEYSGVTTTPSTSNTNSSTSTPGAPNTGGSVSTDNGSTTYDGTLYNQSGVAVSSPVSGTIYYNQSGTPIFYLNGYYYYPTANKTGSSNVDVQGGTPTSNGWYTTTGGAQVYYYNGWYYYPIATISGGSSTTPGVPNTGSTGTGTTVTGGTTVTPGAPNTGAGGSAALNWAVLLLASLGAAGGMAYATRSMIAR
jgi:hypothetical protein